MMADNETLVSQLYHTYGELFPDKKEFWFQLEQEEVTHARSLNDLADKLATGEVIFDQNRFKKESISLFNEIVGKRLTQAKTEPITLVEALANGVNIENALLEKDIFHIFASDSVAVRNVLNTLAEDTSRHRRTIQAELARLNSV